MTDEEMRLTRLVAEQGSQIALLTQNARVHKLVLEQIKYDLKQEREAVVAWLRAECGSPGHEDRYCAFCDVRRNIANEIELGVHRESEKYAVGYDVWGRKK
jgi:CRISPR/Cas system-associated protein Cas10 (large subunit of type III CRISPR-Cas system)